MFAFREADSGGEEIQYLIREIEENHVKLCS
jgi:hypothetical protein